MLRLTAKTDTSGIHQALGPTAIRKSTARALTRLAFDARDAVRAMMPARFTLRRRWVVQGIGASPASPQRLMATVYSRDWFMAYQEAGGVKTGKLAVPLGPMAQWAKTKVIPRSLYPRSILRKKTAFIRRSMVMVRNGRNVTPMYMLRKSQAVKPRFGMIQCVDAFVAARIGSLLHSKKGSFLGL